MNTIFLTGASGFLGSYVLEELLQNGDKVIALTRPTSNLWRIKHLIENQNLVLIKGSLSDSKIVEDIFKSTNIDTVCHLAWEGVGNQFRNEVFQIKSNLESSINLIDMASKYGVKQWIGLGSQAEYGLYNDVIHESFCTHPTTVYGSVKLAVATIGSQISKSTNMNFCWLRLFSSYGPKDDPNWMYCYVIQTLLEGKSPKLTEGKQRWDYIYAQDAAKAISVIALQGNINGIYNLGSGTSQTIKYIVELIKDMINPSIDIDFGAVPYRDDQVMFLQADITKLSSAIQWSPITSLQEGFAKTISWHRSLHQ